MNKHLFLLSFVFMILSSCDKKEAIDILDGVNPDNMEFFFTGELNGEILDMHTSSEDTLLTARVGGCARDYFSKIYTYPSGPPNLEIGLIQFIDGECASQEQLDKFDGAFEPGTYPFNVYDFSGPGIKKSASIIIQTDAFVAYDSEQTDNSNSYFEITSSVDASDNFYKQRIIEGKLSCNLKHTLSSSIVRLEDATFRILVSLEK